MDWDRRRFDDRRGESYRPAERNNRSPSRGYDVRHRRSPPRTRSPPRQRADTWVPSSSRGYGRPRSRSPLPYRRRSRTPPATRNFGPTPYERRRSPPRRFSPRRDDRIRSPPPSQNWRSKSPYSDNRSRDASGARNSDRRAPDTTSGNQVFRPIRREGPTGLTIDNPPRAPSSGIQSEISLAKSPVHAPQRDYPPEVTKRDTTLSPPRHASSTQASSSQPSAIPGPSTPAVEKPGVVAQRARSRSPVQSPLPSQRPSKPPGRSPYRNQMEPSHSQKRIEPEDRSSAANHPSVSPSDNTRVSSPQTSGTRIGGNIPTQPKNHGAFPQPPSGPYQGSRSSSQHHHGSPHVSLLSAPTRPRRGLGPRETWMGTPPARRGGAANSQVPPAGPRASFSSPTPGGGYRYPTFRQSSTSSAAQQQSTSKGANHLAALCTIIPEGRSLPSLLDPAVEKRLVQLELDKEKLLEQVTETQRSKRAQLREWDRLDRESSICALKSELAEGHLQRMTDESIGSGTLF